MAELSIQEKKALVRKTYPEPELLNLRMLLNPNKSVKELITSQFKGVKDNPFVLEGRRFGKQTTISIEKKEGIKLAIEMAENNELLVPFVESRIELIKKRPKLILIIPEEERTEEEKSVALESSSNIAPLLGEFNFEMKKIFAKGKEDWCIPRDFMEGLTDSQIKELIDINPNLICNLKTEQFTKEILYMYLERMVKGNLEPKIAQYSCKIPDELKDIIYWRSICMVSGWCYSLVPKERKEEIITPKIVDYTLVHSKSYVGFLWMAEHMPERCKTAEVFKKLIEKHPFAAAHLPEHLKNDAFYMELAEIRPDFIEHIDYNTASIEVLAMCMSKTNQLLFCDKKIPKNKWNEDLAIAIAKAHGNFSFIPKEWKTRAVAEAFVSRHADLSQIPKEYLDEEMCLHAVRHNAYAITYVPEKIKTERFWNICKEEGLLGIKAFPDEYVDEDYVIKKIKQERIYTFDDIPEEFRTEKVVLVFAEKQTRNRTIPKEYQTEAVVKTLYEHWTFESTYSECFFWSTIREDLRSREALERLSTESSAAIEILLTKEDIEAHLNAFPDNVIYAPNWYLNKYIRQTPEEQAECKETEEVVTVVEEKSTTTAKITTKTTSINKHQVPEIDDGSFKQLSIWDILTA